MNFQLNVVDEDEDEDTHKDTHRDKDSPFEEF